MKIFLIAVSYMCAVGFGMMWSLMLEHWQPGPLRCKGDAQKNQDADSKLPNMKSPSFISELARNLALALVLVAITASLWLLSQS